MGSPHVNNLSKVIMRVRCRNHHNTKLHLFIINNNNKSIAQ